MMCQRLDKVFFRIIVANTPLISIDLIVKNDHGRVLLGKRVNKPAQGYWFVPGRRIFKGESFQSAFISVCNEELGIAIDIRNSRFLGVYEHFYENNFSGEDFSTHYIVHGYEININSKFLSQPLIQYECFQWMSVSDLLSSDAVHQYTKNYFITR
ncbi:GDP-mannose mannosyl hydrolase [Candidatus Symbiopectobacterium sp. 'North America']|uniref:GDP-mannose mannosyl hydrolase n=1 Tax=Candidatus Symbiopectobacterium sp. 'North America' TaxID=2794574 RepID=UPI0027DE90C0|nr:GDP-mannose mannosyl hydrolase [Candidatus Symbiopectobacterium sp. 'North America']